MKTHTSNRIRKNANLHTVVDIYCIRLRREAWTERGRERKKGNEEWSERVRASKRVRRQNRYVRDHMGTEERRREGGVKELWR